MFGARKRGVQQAGRVVVWSFLDGPYSYAIQSRLFGGGDVIKSFRHKGLKEFFEKGSKAGIRPAHAEKLRRQLAKLNAAKAPVDMNVPGWSLHALIGRLAGHWAVSVSGNWRMTFAFDDGDAILVDYLDYH